MIYNNEIERYLCDKMDNLLQEAQEQGYCFEFNIECPRNTEYNKHESITMWTDDDSFCFDIIKSS